LIATYNLKLPQNKKRVCTKEKRNMKKNIVMIAIAVIIGGCIFFAMQHYKNNTDVVIQSFHASSSQPSASKSQSSAQYSLTNATNQVVSVTFYGSNNAAVGSNSNLPANNSMLIPSGAIKVTVMASGATVINRGISPNSNHKINYINNVWSLT
jgi:hypothetical protein